MPKDREMTPADYYEVAEVCSRKTVNFSGSIMPDDELQWLGIDVSGEFEMLKDWLAGKLDIETGVTRFFYRINRKYLADLDGSWTQNDLVARLMERSIPDMNYRRAMIVVSGAAGIVTGTFFPNPAPASPLSTLGIDNTNIAQFVQTLETDPHWGVHRFNRVIDKQHTAGLVPGDTVGKVIDILKMHSKPAF